MTATLIGATTSTACDTLAGGARLFVRYPGPRILAVALIALATTRIALGEPATSTSSPDAAEISTYAVSFSRVAVAVRALVQNPVQQSRVFPPRRQTESRGKVAGSDASRSVACRCAHPHPEGLRRLRVDQPY